MSDIQNPPLQFIESFQFGIETGVVTSTVRIGWRNYKPGIVLATDPESKVKWAKHIHVLEVRLTEARNVESEMMGYDTQAEFYEDMKTFGEKYADFGPDSEVTVFYFVLPEKLETERQELDDLNKMTLSEDDFHGHPV